MGLLMVAAAVLAAHSSANAQSPPAGALVRVVPPSLASFQCRLGERRTLGGRIVDPKFENGQWLVTVKVSSSVDGLTGDYRGRWLYGSLLMRRGGRFDLDLSLLLFEPKLDGTNEANLLVHTGIATGLGAPQRLTGTCETIAEGAGA
jgi:hypothetical protein